MFRKDNLYTIIDKIKSIIAAGKLSPEKNAVLTQVLYGDNQHAGLISLTKKPDQHHVQEIIEQIKSLRASASLFQLDFKLTLRNTLQILQQIKHARTSTTYARIHDVIFQETDEKYHGTIVAPIMQTLDYRLGKSKGECSGYVLQWIQSLLSNQHPFGVHHEFGAIFKPIKLDSPVGQTYPELNQGIILTESISRMQRSNRDSNFVFFNHKKKRIFRHIAHRPLVYAQREILADVLNQAASSDNVIYIAIRNGFRGHALGFHVDKNNHYHFLDVNSGWYKFESFTDFSEWLPFYFQQKQYGRLYPEIYLHAYNLSSDVKLGVNVGVREYAAFAKEWVGYHFHAVP